MPSRRRVDALGSRRAGHRLLPHTADVIVEAWGPDRATCFEHAVFGLVDAFIDRGDVAAGESTAVEIAPAEDEEMLISLLEAAIYAVDVRGRVPVAVTLAERADGGIEGSLGVVPLNRVEVVGSPPKGVSRHALSIERRAGRWECRVTVDV